MTYLADPLSVRCRYVMCGALAGERCTRAVSWSPVPFPPAKRPHKIRVMDALAVAAHSDPELDRYAFGGTGPCGLCGVEGLGARHRVVDAIAGMLAAGEDPEVTADEFGVSLDAVRVVARWCEKWPGAWL